MSRDTGRRGTTRRRCKECGVTVDADTGPCRNGHSKGFTWSFSVDVQAPGAPRKQITRGGFALKKEAVAAMKEADRAASRGSRVETSKLTVRQYLVDRWLPAAKTDLKPSTYAGYRSAVLTRIVPRIGDVRLQAVDGSILDGLYAELLESGRHDGQGGLSARSVRLTHVVMHLALGQAVKWRLLERNPADDAEPPSAKSAKAPEAEMWRADELRSFLDSLVGDRLRGMYLFAGMTGMRRGEVAGVKWDDVDLDRGRVHVRRNRVAVGGVVHEGTPKSKASTRTIKVGVHTVAALREWRRLQLEDRLQWGPGWTDSGYTFTREDGNPIHPDRISKVFDARVKKWAGKRIPFHGLRHTHVAVLIAQGEHPKVIQSRLGHGSIQVTLDLYGHLFDGLDEAAAETADEAILGGM